MSAWKPIPPFTASQRASYERSFRESMKKLKEDAEQRKAKRTPPPPPSAPDPLAQLWLDEFVVDHFCGLCANTGLIGPLASMTPAGRLVVLSQRPCICPNGRVLRREGATP